MDSVGQGLYSAAATSPLCAIKTARAAARVLDADDPVRRGVDFPASAAAAPDLCLRADEHRLDQGRAEAASIAPSSECAVARSGRSRSTPARPARHAGSGDRSASVRRKITSVGAISGLFTAPTLGAKHDDLASQHAAAGSVG
ncbi:MAG: hypothetical protein IPO61_17915 [Gammaproteobacteria bacterium]|nr:hypothetical protein [Gammaproteobacteria bacterium]